MTHLLGTSSVVFATGFTYHVPRFGTVHCFMFVNAGNKWGPKQRILANCHDKRLRLYYFGD